MNNVCIPTRGVLLLCCHVQYMVCSVLIPAWTAVQGRHKHMCMDRGYLTLGFVDCGRLRLRMDPHKGEVSVDICSMRILSIHQHADTGSNLLDKSTLEGAQLRWRPLATAHADRSSHTMGLGSILAAYSHARWLPCFETPTCA